MSAKKEALAEEAIALYKVRGYTKGPDRVKSVWDFCRRYKHPYVAVYTRRTHADFNYSMTLTNKELSEQGYDALRSYIGEWLGPEKNLGGYGKHGSLGYKEGVVLQIPIKIAETIARWFFENESAILDTVEDDD